MGIKKAPTLKKNKKFQFLIKIATDLPLRNHRFEKKIFCIPIF